MAEVTNELIYEVLKQMQDHLTTLDTGMAELRQEMNAMRLHMIAIQTDTSNIYARLGHLETRTERIERRLDIADAPAL
jgi:predicted  nucleic acid-binding Zn-ribbon protein